MARQTTFSAFMNKERARLDKARKDALASKSAVDRELASIERELTALEAYREAKGTSVSRAPGKRAAAEPGRSKAASRATGRKGEKRQAVLDLIHKNPNGLSRGEILLQLGVKGNKSAEQSVSNALSALKKLDKVNSREGKYVTA